MSTTPKYRPSLTALLEGMANLSLVPDWTPLGLSLDSRVVVPGSLFLACRGATYHGLTFAEQAISKGAVGILFDPAEAPIGKIPTKIPCIAIEHLTKQIGPIADRFYGHPSRALRVIGITGTNGKTSCCHFLAQALHPQKTCGVMGTLGNGLYGQLQPGSHTTPDAVQLHQLMAEFLSAGASSVVMEVSSHALAQERVNGVAYDLAILSNLSRDHLDYHGSLAAYGEVKGRLFLKSGLAKVILPSKDPLSKILLPKLPQSLQGVLYGLGNRPKTLPDRWPYLGTHSLQIDAQGLTMDIVGPWGQGTVRSPLLGRFNAENLLAVLAALLLEDLPWSKALQRLQAITPIPGRMERFGGQANQPLVVVDYAHTPDALAKVLCSLHHSLKGYLSCVFGCGGNRDQGKRPLMGEIADQYSDRIILTDDNPRDEDGTNIINDILTGIKDTSKVAIERDRRRALSQVIRQAKQGDVILVAGKGHESYQQIGDRYLPLDDRCMVREALAQR